MPNPTTAVTETPNELTDELDQCSAVEILRLLRQVDSQIFSGWRGLPAVHDTAPLNSIAQAAAAVARAVAINKDRPGRACIVMAGSGTSGRMAFLAARTFNALFGEPCCRYLCAGGDVALFSSREAPEDDWECGWYRLAAATRGYEYVVYIGITCGLSAPFVAGQLHYAMEADVGEEQTIVPVLLGFNPVAAARTQRIEGWQYSFSDVAKSLASVDELGSHGIIINPVVGPEAVTGSTRMKGGSATKLLLEMVLGLGWLQASGLEEAAVSDPPSLLRQWLWCYELGVRRAYASIDALAAAVSVVASTLSAARGRVCYLARGTLGIEALIDASECPPTYNADFNDVRAFLCDGYAALGNEEGDLTAGGVGHPELQLSWTSFRDCVLPSLTPADCIVVLEGLEPWSLAAESEVALLQDICRQAQAKAVSLVGIVVGPEASALTLEKACGRIDFASTVHLPFPSKLEAGLPHLPPQYPFVAELSAKLLLNALSTAGFVLKGKVMTNRMIDLQVSNNKLFFRAIGIVANFSANKADEDAARRALLRAIYGIDAVGEQHNNAAVSAHIAQAAKSVAKGVRIVPTAILLANRPELSFTDACQILQEQPIVRRAISQVTASQ